MTREAQFRPDRGLTRAEYRCVCQRHREQMREIVALAAPLFGFSVADLFARGRRQPVCDARFAVWQISRELLAVSTTSVGAAFGRQASTIWLGLRSGAALAEYNRAYRARCDDLRRLARAWFAAKEGGKFGSLESMNFRS